MEVRDTLRRLMVTVLLACLPISVSAIDYPGDSFSGEAAISDGLVAEDITYQEPEYGKCCFCYYGAKITLDERQPVEERTCRASGVQWFCEECNSNPLELYPASFSDSGVIYPGGNLQVPCKAKSDCRTVCRNIQLDLKSMCDQIWKLQERVNNTN